MYADDEMIMISSLKHYVFCSRRCALVHLEQLWTENHLTAAGRSLHEHVDTVGHQARKDFYQATAVRLVSHKLGLTGIADMLEFYQVSSPYNTEGACIATQLKRKALFWVPFPVEYKHGKPDPRQADEIQLCAQALCLEEMLNVSIFKGALFYGKTRRRVDILFDDALRSKTIEIANKVHTLIREGKTPPAVYGKWCESCSLIDACRPKEFEHPVSAKKWIDKQVCNVLSLS